MGGHDVNEGVCQDETAIFSFQPRKDELDPPGRKNLGSVPIRRAHRPTLFVAMICPSCASVPWLAELTTTAHRSLDPALSDLSDQRREVAICKAQGHVAPVFPSVITHSHLLISAEPGRHQSGRREAHPCRRQEGCRCDVERHHRAPTRRKKHLIEAGKGERFSGAQATQGGYMTVVYPADRLSPRVLARGV